MTTFCVVDINFYGREIEVPYTCAAVLLDGADIPFFGLIQEIPPDQVRMGLRVKARWARELSPDFSAIECFVPTGEPDAGLRHLQGAPVMRDIAIVGFAQSKAVRQERSLNDVEMLMPVLDGAITASGIGKKEIGFTCSGSTDFLIGVPFSFVTALDGVGAWPPIEESHVEMDGGLGLVRSLGAPADGGTSTRR